MRTPLVVLALAVTAPELGAQALRATVGATAVSVRVRSRLPAGTGALSGTAFGGEASLSVGRVLLAGSYRQGKVTSDGGTAPSRDLVEGGASLGVRLRDWLTLAGGPRARAYVVTGGSQRWLFWELRARAEGAFIGSAVRGYVELWRALAGDVGVPEPFDRAQGGEAGMTVRVARRVEARVAYRIDHAVLGGGSRVETVDGLVVGVGLGR